MSNGRTVAWLVVGIAAVTGVHVALDVKTQEAPRALRRNSLEKFAEKMTFFSVAHQDGSEVRLVNDGTWKIVSPYAAEAEQSAVLRLSDALAFAPVADEMTDAELLRIGRTREDFGLDRPRVVVTVGDAKSGAATPVRFGLSTPAGDGVYATVGESDTVYVVPSNVFSAVNLDASGFRRRRIFNIDPSDVTSFDIKNGTGHFVRLVRTDNAWQVSKPHESVASPDRVRSFLDAIVRLEAQEFAWPTGAKDEPRTLSDTLLSGYGLLDDSVVVVTLKCADGTDHAIGFGKDAGKGLVYALAPGGSVVAVSAAVRATAVAGMDAFVDSRIFPVDPAAVSAISLDDDGTAYLLSRKPGSSWRLDAPVSAAADAEAVDALIGRLLTLKSPDVDTNGVCVAIGTNAAPVSVSRKALLTGVMLADLRSKEILRIDPKLVKRVTVTDSGKKPVSVIFDAEKSAWTVESAEATGMADGESVAKLVSALSPLTATRIVQLKVAASELGRFGLDKPFRTVAIDQTAEGALRRNILIGDVTDGGRFATIGAADAVFVISSECASALLAPIVK